MRHQRKNVKLGRSQAHRDALLANQVISLIEHNRITTTVAKAKAVRPLAEKMVTLGKKKTLHARRTALAVLRHNEGAVKALFEEVAPRAADRKGGYTRIVKLGMRKSDAAPMAFIEWVDGATVEVEVAKPTPAKKAVSKKVAPKAEAAATDEPKLAKKPRAKKTEEKPKDE